MQARYHRIYPLDLGLPGYLGVIAMQWVYELFVALKGPRVRGHLLIAVIYLNRGRGGMDG